MPRVLFAAVSIAFAAALVFAMAACSKGLYVGSTLSTVYHDPTCVWAEQIDRDRRVWFEDAVAAEAAGYGPCATCVGGSE